MIRPHHTILGLTGLLTATLLGCGQAPRQAATPSNAGQQTQVLGAATLEFDFQNSQVTVKNQINAQGLVSPNVFQFVRVLDSSKGAVINDAATGRKYYWSTYEIKNLSNVTWNNFTFYAYNKSAENIGGTAAKDGFNADGQSLTNPNSYRALRPTHGTVKGVTSLQFDAARSNFQVLRPSEAEAIETAARTAGAITASDDVLEYGFWARSVNGGRSIPPGGLGVITVGYSLPLNLPVSDSPTKWQATFQLATDSFNRVTRAYEETTAQAVSRAQAIGATQVGLIGTDADVAGNGLQTVRVADPKLYTPDAPIVPTGINVPNPISEVGSSTSFDGSAYDGVNHRWTFSDGTTAQGSYVQHKFGQPGLHTATLTYTDTQGAAQQATTQVSVLPEMKDIPKKRAISDSMTAEFDAGEPLPGFTYSWSFGDGTTGNGSRTKHTYSKLGTYDVKLAVYDSRGNLQSQQVGTRNLSAQATPGESTYDGKTWITIWRKAPEALFDLETPKGKNVPAGKLPLTVSFNANTSRDYNTESSDLTYEWDFGDGTTATGAVVQHVYTKQKAFYPYLVTLKVKNKWGLTDTRRVFVHPRDIRAVTVFNAVYTAAASSLSATGNGGNSVTLAQNTKSSSASQPQNTSLTTQNTDVVEEVFPYVLPANNRIANGKYYPVNSNGDAIKPFCVASKLYVNGGEVSPLLDQEYDQNFQPTGLCKGILFVGSIGTLPVRPLNTVLATGGPHSDATTFHVFRTLSVPKVFVSVVPDDFIKGEVASPVLQENSITDPATGKKQFILNARIRKSEVKDGILTFKVPVLAVDNTGKFMNTTNGIFNARFVGIDSNCGDCTMVNGRGYITIKVFAPEYALGQKQLDLTKVQMLSGNNDCNPDNSPLAAATTHRLAGCTNITATYDFPTENAPVEIPVFPFDPTEIVKFGNHIFYGEDADTVRRLAILARSSQIVAQAYVTWFAAYTQIPEKKDAFLKAVNKGYADGKLTLKERADLVMMEADIVLSLLPGAVKPSLVSVSAASRSGVGAVDQALITSIDESIVAGRNLDGIAREFDDIFGTAAVILRECAPSCINQADNIVGDLVQQGLPRREALNRLDDYLKSETARGISKQDALANAGIVPLCPIVRSQAFNNSISLQSILTQCQTIVSLKASFGSSFGNTALRSNGQGGFDTVEHILFGHVERGGGGLPQGFSGGHYEPFNPAGIEVAKVRLDRGLVKAPTALATRYDPAGTGAYQVLKGKDSAGKGVADVLIYFEGGQRIASKKDLQSYFPVAWSPEKILSEIIAVSQSAPRFPGNTPNQQRFTGVSPSGLRITGFINTSTNKIENAYPDF